MRFLILILTIFAAVSGSAQQPATEREHPRVAELQDKMTEYVRGYLQTRLQGVPFMVTVKIEAMRRKAGSKYVPQSEKLPYYDLAEEEIRDEWDDPSASLYALQARIQKAVVLISLPKGLDDQEVQEIQDSLTTLLRLIPGRDEIKVERRPWSMDTSKFPYYAGLVAASIVFMLLGLLLISKRWATQLSTAISEIKPKERTDDAGAVHVPGAGDGTPIGAGIGQKSMAGDVNFRDHFRTREFVAGRIAELTKNPGFPNLPAMIEMDKLAEFSPKDLGALLMEFPIEMQNEVFRWSSSVKWLAAFSEPGDLSPEAVALAEKLGRMQYDTKSPDWERLLIQCWRLDDQRVNFLKSIAREEAFAILKAMPASAAVPAARLAFPGAWAVLLDSKYKAQPVAPARVKELLRTALEFKPLNNPEALQAYKQEKDLLSYLLVASVPEERDVYGALPKNSYLWQVRPPFFRVMELSQEELVAGFNKVPLDDWALALFNVSREGRKVIEAQLNSKQKFMFSSKMRSIDMNGVDRVATGMARERIAKLYQKLSNEKDNLESAPVEENEKSAA